MPKYTPEEYAELLTKFGSGFPAVVAKATLVGAQQLRTDIPGRIHRVGGTKDIEGNTRSYKDGNYKKKRQAQGLQVTKVDHTFTGDLQRSYKLFTNNRSNIDLRIFGGNNIDKARGNEDEYSNPVWEASKKEEQRAREAFDEVITEYINKFFS